MEKFAEMARRAALERERPSNALDRVAQEAIKRHLESRSALDTYAHRAALTALRESETLHHRFLQQQLEPLRALQARLAEVSQSILDQAAVAQKAVAAAMLYTHQNALLQSRELIASAALNSVRQFQDSHQHILAGLRSALEHDLSPTLAAIQTMRTLGLASISPEFSEYVSGALDEIEESDSQEISKTVAETLEVKSKGLTPQQQFRLTIALTVLGILIALYQAIQAGRPIKIDPAQLHELKAHPEVTINIYYIFSQINDSVEYEIERKVPLKLKPTNNSMTMVTLEVNDRVKLIRMSHQWVYVEYHDEEEDLPIYGWVNKKYLKRLR